MSPEEALTKFCNELPVLGLVGTPHKIHQKPYTVDEDVQLVCKYLRALKTGGIEGINKLYKEGIFVG